MSEQIKKERETSSKTWKTLVAAVAAVVICLIVGFLPFHYFPMPGKANEFGDAFGFMNAFVSACAFTALIVTMFWQREELQMQRKELELTRLELNRSAEAQEKSQQSMLAAAVLSALESLREASDSSDKSDTFYDSANRKLLRNRFEFAICSELRRLGRDPTQLGDMPEAQRIAESLLAVMATLLRATGSAELQIISSTVSSIVTNLEASSGDSLPTSLTINDGYCLNELKEVASNLCSPKVNESWALNVLGGVARKLADEARAELYTPR